MTNLNAGPDLPTLDLTNAVIIDDSDLPIWERPMPEFAARLIALGDQFSRGMGPDWAGDEVLGFTVGILLAQHPDPLVAAVCRQGAVQLTHRLGLYDNRMRVAAFLPDGFTRGCFVTSMNGDAHTMSTPFNTDRFRVWLCDAVVVLAASQSEAMLWMGDADLQAYRAMPHWAFRRGAFGGPDLPAEFLALAPFVLNGGDVPVVPESLR